MDKAFSLFSCSLVSIDKLLTIDENNKKSLLNYGKNQYVCPECYKPLFPKSISSDFSKPHFSHYEKGIYDPDCTIRNKKKRNKIKDYINNNNNIAKQIFQEIYIKSSCIHIKKTIILFVNQILNKNNKDYLFTFNKNSNSINIYTLNSKINDQSNIMLNIENKDYIYIFNKYSDLIFSFENSRSKFGNRQICEKIISPLLEDIRAGKNETSEEFICEAIDEIFLTISLTKGFKNLQAYIIYAGLILTIISYSRRSIKKQNGYYSIDIKNILDNLPLNIKESFLSFFATIPGFKLSDKAEEYQVEEHQMEFILKNNKFMTSIKERAVWFLNIIKFDDIDLSDLEKLETFEKIDHLQGYIYTATSPDLKLIYGSKEVLKIGRSRDPLRREIQLSGQLFNNPIKITRLWKVIDQVKAEAIIFDKLSEIRIKKSREIFLLSQGKSDLIISKILTENNLLAS